MPRYNNPEIGEAFSNLAKLFAPPSAQDMYMGAKMQRDQQDLLARQAAVSRIRARDPSFADLLDTDPTAAINNYGALQLAQRAALPGATPESLGIFQLGAGRPFKDTAGGFREDLRSEEARNAADNRAKVAVAALAPVQQDAVRFGAPSVAQIYGMEELAQPRAGNISLKPGEAVRTPDGRTINGPAKPMTAENYFNVMLPDGTTALTADGKTDVAGRPLAAVPVGKVSMSVQGDRSAVGLAPTTSNQTEANRLGAELETGRYLIQQARQLAQANPGVFGLSGAIRGGVQDLGQTITEMLAAYGDQTPELAGLGRQALSELNGVAPNYDPAIGRARKMLLDLAYLNARLNNSNGDIGRNELEHSLASLGVGGPLSNTQSLMAALDAMEQNMAARAAGMQALRAPGAVRSSAPPAGPQPGAVVDGYRFRGGNPADPNSWEKVQ